MQRLRSRIAADLHDDLGSSLSRISILSEVAVRRLDDSADDSRKLISNIGQSAREMIDATADMVWSIDPRRDDLGSLVMRTRAFVGEVLDARHVAWTLNAPIEASTIRLRSDQRRHLYLVIKEAVNNIAKHADAANVRIEIQSHDGRLGVDIIDDGRGVPDSVLNGGAGADEGNGLRNMSARITELKGEFLIERSSPAGTAIRLTVPLH